MSFSFIPDAWLSAQAYDFDLPEELIAQHPLPCRSDSRLLDARQSAVAHRCFNELPSLLNAHDLIIFNNTQVIKARLWGQKTSGGKLEALVERVLPAEADGVHREVVVHLKTSKKPRESDDIWFAHYHPSCPQKGFYATFIKRWPDENGALFLLRFSQDAYAMMEQYGHVPLPPYIQHSDDANDEQRYQSIFARHRGAVAAPTASLHFDAEVLNALKEKNIATAFLTLHVGAGTFAPVKSQDIRQHQMHHERYQIPQETLAAIQSCREKGGRILAVGTTVARTLETWAKTQALNGDTSIFIYPGFQFQVVDLLLTNFHLPRSTLMMLVSAFAGYENIRHAYQEAIAQRYRFFSYGDAMLLERAHA